VSARYGPRAVLAMAVFMLGFYWICRNWSPNPAGQLLDTAAFMARPEASWLLLCLLGISTAGGMFVVPLYAFLTTFVDKAQTSRTIAANNIVNSLAMVVGSLMASALSLAGVPIVEQLLLSAAMCVVSAWIAAKLIAAERLAAATG
ncbi:MAG: hypothetical protein RIQ99_2014, partial [Pseudomonadota bacterium]